ncbi:MAG: hypothetical protein CMM16_03515 [Rhodospirillaceae bacterium]|nr:hypothetical protein [Rhodospirillaceae bacterium]MAI49621.1 hypothetical protein [Rhodospirillaceae bacterium]
MTLTVSSQGSIGWAVFRGRQYRCAIGRGGISACKIEGDGASPVGNFNLTKVLYRPDRGAKPLTTIAIDVISASDGWCDSPDHEDYNTLVALPHAARCEALWRDDALYDIVVVTNHNSDPVVPRAGSAIFIHIAAGPGYPPTEGCVAFARHDLELILQHWIPGEDRLVITQAPTWQESYPEKVFKIAEGACRK